MTAGSRIIIDAGQTGTRVRVHRSDGHDDHDAEPVYTDRPVVEQVAAIARTVLAPSSGPVSALAAGVSGLTPDYARPDSLLAMVSDLGITAVVLAHDSVSAYLAANRFADGVTCAVGTGVVALGVGPAGTWRVDGWGHLVGDAGSAYWIGRAGIDAALRSFDGRTEPSPLEDSAVETFGPLPELYMSLQGAPDRVARIAGFATQVDDAARGGDATAIDICRRAAAELATSASAALHRSGWSPGRDARISWMGNVLSHNDLIRETFAAEMIRRAPGATVGAPLGTSLDGVDLLLALPPEHALTASVARAAA